MSHRSSSFSVMVLAVVAKIPRGRTMTYGEVARLAGRAKAARAVGNVLRGNFNSKIPCHRVIRADGRVGKYNRGQKEKIAKLRREGVRGLK